MVFSLRFADWFFFSTEEVGSRLEARWLRDAGEFTQSIRRLLEAQLSGDRHGLEVAAEVSQF
jgi:hypothetical protein